MIALRTVLATVVVILALPSTALADYVALGNGKDGNLTISTGENRVVNTYARVTASPIDRTVPVATTEGFEANDLIMIWQVGGLDSAPPDAETLTLDGSSVGRYELARITSVTTSSLILDEPLSNIYDSALTQVVRVPEYWYVKLDQGSLVRAKPWDGETGGIVAFLAREEIQSYGGYVSASGAGFRGGEARIDGPDDASTGCTEPRLAPPSGAMSGEGIAGRGFGRGRFANGGGSGVCSRGNGGGGSNIGKGGHAIGNNGGMGGAAIVPSPLERLIMGGGGGAGHRANQVAGNGGNGGGVVYIRARDFTGPGFIEANGEPGADIGDDKIDGLGGAGAGGTISVRLESAAGDCNFSGQLSAAGASADTGGNGGGGFIYLQGSLTACLENTDSVDIRGGGSGTVAGGDGAVEVVGGPFCGGFSLTCYYYSGGVCDYETNECVGCLSEWDCSRDTPLCDLSTKTCVPCSETFVCPQWHPICQESGACDLCSKDEECAGSPYGPFCLEGYGQCVQCRDTDDDCSGATPYCNWSQCVPCEADGPPTCSDPSRPACHNEGPLAGHCTACKKDKPYMCGGVRPVCIESTGECGCTEDSQCGVPNSGMACNGSEASPGICVAGCSTAAGRNGCPGGQRCSKTDGSLGRCISQPCSTGADCASPTPSCDTSVEPHVCVECMTSGDCGDSLVCDSSKKCVECTSAQAGNCKKHGAGAACLPNGTCGCASDADCGADRACDTKTGKCEGKKPPSCPSCEAKNECHLAGKCNEATFTCTAPRKPNGSACARGVCIDGVCTPSASGGGGGPSVSPDKVETCSSGKECPSGFCVDGVCCDSACEKPCHSCALATSPGVCTAMPAGVDLRGDCGKAGACSKTCGADGQCVDADETTECARVRCTGASVGVGPVMCTGALSACDEASALPFDCGAYACIPAFGACASMCRSHDDCAPGHVCNVAGQCIAPPSEVTEGGGKGDGGGCSVSARGSSSTGLAKVFGFVIAAGLIRRRWRKGGAMLAAWLVGLSWLLFASPALAQGAPCDDFDDCEWPTGYCDSETGQCVGCRNADDCTHSLPVCLPTTRMCGLCESDADCPSDQPACDVERGRCRECTTDDYCEGSSVGPYCLPSGDEGGGEGRWIKPLSGSITNPNVTGICVECLTDAQCPATAPSCHPYSWTCEPCESSGPPSCSDPSRPVCNDSGTLKGQCTECNSESKFKCGGAKPICIDSLGVCGCTKDAQCGPPGSGLVCSGTTSSPGVCIAGCSTAAGRNDCPAGQYCSDKSGAIGECLPAPCSANADCEAPTPACDKSVKPSRCVQCAKDGDCPSGLVCNGEKKCVECTASDKSSCSKDGTGAACLANGTCGCASDADCGNGRTCDAGSGKCVAGCPPCGAKNECHLPGACNKATATCSTPRKPNGSPCSYGVCVDGNCTPTSSGGSTPPPVVSGDVTTCTSGGDCPSGFCVDGVCCDSACDQACHSCALPYAPGVCTAVPVGVDPRGDCGSPSACTSTCGPGGQCTGADEATLCAAPRCTDAARGVGPAFCPGPGVACDTSATLSFDCGAYACLAPLGACASKCSSAEECAPGYACNESGQCVAPDAPAGNAKDDGGGWCSVSALGSSSSSLRWLGLVGFVLAGGLIRRSLARRSRSTGALLDMATGVQHKPAPAFRGLEPIAGRTGSLIGSDSRRYPPCPR